MEEYIEVLDLVTINHENRLKLEKGKNEGRSQIKVWQVERTQPSNKYPEIFLLLMLSADVKLLI
jgi:hypothetical protein